MGELIKDILREIPELQNVINEAAASGDGFCFVWHNAKMQFKNMVGHFALPCYPDKFKTSECYECVCDYLYSLISQVGEC